MTVEAGRAEGTAAGRLPAVVYALLALLCAALYAPGFTSVPPFDRDESRFAQASFQMLETGDLVDIRFQDEARHKKPVGIYWLQAASTALLGTDGEKAIWTYRVPSLLAAVAAVLATAWLGARLFGPAVGTMAAVMLAGCVVLGVEARMAKTDALLLATITVAQAALAALYLGRHGERPGWGLPLLFWVAVGLSVLVKGPIVALVSGGTVAVLALWDRRAAWLARLRPLAGLGIVLLIAAPWLIAITLKTQGAFFAESVGHDMMGKVAGGQEGKGLPPGYYLGTFFITFAPWSFLTLLALPWIWRNRRNDAVRFCIAWIVPTWIIFEAVPTKLLHYTLPVFPAVALLTAGAALDATAPTAMRLLRWASAALGVGAMAALALAVALVPWLVDGDVAWAAWLAVPVVVALAVIAVRLRFGGKPREAVAAALAGAVLLYAVAYAAVLPNTPGLWIGREAGVLVAANRPCASTRVASAGYSEPSLVFAVGTDTLLTRGEGAARHLLDNPACALALVDGREEAAFRTGLAGADARPLGTVRGFNYNNGRRIALTLYRLAPAPAVAAPTG